MVAFRVRKASDDDAAALNRIINDERVNRYLLMDGSTMADTVNWLAKNKDGLFIADLDGHAVGMARYVLSFHKSSHTASFSIYVDADYHRCGIGRALMEAMFEELREKGIKRVESHGGVLADNETGLAFYKKLGFKIEGVQHAAYRRGDDYIDGIYIARFL